MAQNVIISAIYLGNFPEIDTYEGNYAAEYEDLLTGTYGSVSEPLYQNVVTIDTDSPTQWIDTDQDTGNGTLTYDVGSGTTTVGLDSMVTFVSVIRFTDGTAVKMELDAIQTTNGDVFLIAWDNSPVLGSKPIEQVELGEVSYDAWGGFAQSSYDTTLFVCFAPGTRILTPLGEVPVQTLAAGDLVETADRGPQPLIWVGERTLRFPGSNPAQKPVALEAGALGGGMPRNRLVVSPQHRILLSGPLVEDAIGAIEAFAPAHSLTIFPGIRRMFGTRQITYHALLLDRHDIIFAEGAPVESLHVGPMAVEALSPVQRLEILAAMAVRSGRRRRPKLARNSIKPRQLDRWPARVLGTRLLHVPIRSAKATAR